MNEAMTSTITAVPPPTPIEEQLTGAQFLDKLPTLLYEEFKNFDFIALDGVEIYQYMPPQMIPQLDRICKSRLNCGKPIVIMTFGNLSNFNGGSGWASLLRNCITIRLPQTGR